MSVSTEAITLIFLLRAMWLVTMPKHLFVPYEKRTDKPSANDDETVHEQDTELGESGAKSRSKGNGNADAA